jgi:crotonobetainyl-CoA:carnitine CoA-transferase CaiB-like acyl-CoA transferase
MFEGVRVVEVAGWHMVPAAGAVLAEFGADVVKVEHPSGGDPQRGVPVPGDRSSSSGVSLSIEQSNRGKRSVTLDIARPEGRAVLTDLVRTADVFLTNTLPSSRRKLHIDEADIRVVTPDIIYVRGDAVGRRGAEAGKPGFDYSVFWGRGGVAHAVAGPGAPEPVTPRPGFGDRTSSMNIAFGVAAALYRRSRTGEGAVVDVSLLGSGIWSNSGDVVYSQGMGEDFSARAGGRTYHRTADDRWVIVTMPDPTRWWQELARRLGREDLLDDPRFATPAALAENRAALTEELAVGFSRFTLAELHRTLAGADVPWEPVLTPLEVGADPQVVANEYLAELTQPAGDRFLLVRAPVQFDETVPDLRPAPTLGEQTDVVLAELGYDEGAVSRLRDSGIIT